MNIQNNLDTLELPQGADPLAGIEIAPSVPVIVGRHLSALKKPLAEMSSAEVLLLAMQIGAEAYARGAAQQESR